MSFITSIAGFLSFGSVVAVIGCSVKAWLWWDGETLRVKKAVREAAPNIFFQVGSYAGGGEGFNVNVRNDSDTVSAHRLSVTLPGFDEVCWQLAELPPRLATGAQVPVALDAPVRVQRLPGAEAVLTYHDKFGLPYEVHLPLRQTPRDDHRFNFGSTVGRTVTPTLSWSDIWRLRSEV